MTNRLPLLMQTESPRTRLRPSLWRCLVFTILLLSGSRDTFADTIRVIVDRALVWTRPVGVAVVVTQLRRDETAEVVRQVPGWYEIIVPSGALATEIRTGFINASQVVIDTVGPPSDLVVRLRTPPLPPGPKIPGTSFFNVNLLRFRGQNDLTQTVSVFSPTLQEDSTITTNYGSGTGWAFDLLGGGPVWHWVGIGFGLSYNQHDRSALVTASIPHPYFFDTFRPASFTTQPLKARETVFHFPGMFIPPTFGPVKVLLFGGPSVFRLSQTVVTDLKLTEVFPYDTVTINSVVTQERKGTFVGYHAGADVAVLFNRSVGVGVGVRYSHANITEFEKDAAPTSGVAGGVSALGGVRFRF